VRSFGALEGEEGELDVVNGSSTNGTLPVTMNMVGEGYGLTSLYRALVHGLLDC
jgi:hypothetical protein